MPEVDDTSDIEVEIGGAGVVLTGLKYTKSTDYEEVPKEFEFVEVSGSDIPFPVPKNRFDTEFVQTGEVIKGAIEGRGRVPDAIGREIVDIVIPNEGITINDVYFGRIRAGSERWTAKYFARGITTDQ